MPRLSVLCLIVLTLCLGAWKSPLATIAGSALQQDADAAKSNAPRDYTSRHFLMHTDLPQEEAQEELQKLETMLGLIAAYWGRAPSGTIEMYVVRDLKNWPDDAIHPVGLAKIQSGAGVTISQKMTRGNLFVAKAVVYAVAERGVARHEAVHAYCHQTFGAVGPVWYSEGMAEMGQYWVKDDLSVNADDNVIEYLQQSEPRSVQEIVDEQGKNSRTGDSWQDYAWRWALCHVLEVNPNYRRKFRSLGLRYLAGRKASFRSIYGRDLEQLDFEYRFFLQHLESGLRADLCAWDWSKRFTLVSGQRTLSARIDANRGWQPGLAQVKAGKSYSVNATGNWRLSKDADLVSPAGNEGGLGMLQAVLLTKDYQLTEPFDIGPESTFTAQVDGQLYLRCKDAWAELADNSGTVTVKTSLAK